MITRLLEKKHTAPACVVHFKDTALGDQHITTAQVVSCQTLRLKLRLKMKSGRTVMP